MSKKSATKKAWLDNDGSDLPEFGFCERNTASSKTGGTHNARNSKDNRLPAAFSCADIQFIVANRSEWRICSTSTEDPDNFTN